MAFPDGRRRLYEVEVSRGELGLLEDADITIRVVESADGGGAAEQTLHYRRWAATEDADNQGKHHSAALCLQIEGDRLVPFQDTPPLHVFFPTKDSLPFHVLIHASFEVEQSRQHIRDETDQKTFSLLAELLARLVDEAPPDVVLQAFVPEQGPSGGPAHRIWERFKAVLQQRAFVPTIGGNLVRPEEVRLWSYNLGTVLDPASEAVKKAALVVPELMESCRKSLKMLGAQELKTEEYPNLLLHCQTDNREACLETITVLHQVVEKSSSLDVQKRDDYLDACRCVPCWWTDNGRARALKENRPLFWSPPKDHLPQWVELDALDEEFRKQVDKRFPSKLANQQGGGDRWQDLIKNLLHDVNTDNLLHKALVPNLARHAEETWWLEHGGEALRLFGQWTEEREFEKISPGIWEEGKRIDLAYRLKLPTNRGWLPAGQCYAGKVWGGPDSFDDFFCDVDGRGVLAVPNQWPDEIPPVDLEKWKGRLRYAGVSWEPKLLLFKSDEGLHFWDIPPNPWKKSSQDNGSVTRSWSYWSDYCKSLRSFPKSRYDLKKQSALEFFPECLPERALDRLRILKPLGEAVVKSYAVMEFKPKNRKNLDSVQSLAIYQLQKVAWLPCKPSLLHEDPYVAPSEAYMPRKGLGGLLPEVDVTLPDGQEGRDLATFLTQTLKVREDLPNSFDNQWIEWLNELPDVADRSKKDIIGAARELYKKVLDFDSKPPGLAQVEFIPCLIWSDATAEGTGQGASDEGIRLTFRSRDDVYWLDQPYLENPSVKEALLKKGAAVFLLELKAGEKAKYWWGLEPLSQAVTVEPQYEQEDGHVTSKIMERYAQRYQVIQALARKPRSKVPKLDDISFKAVNGLHLCVSYQGEEIATPSVPWWQIVDGPILVDAKKCWFGCGGAIADTAKEEISDIIENLLKAENNEEVLDRLRAKGIPESELHDLEPSMEPEVLKPPSPGEMFIQPPLSEETSVEPLRSSDLSIPRNNNESDQPIPMQGESQSAKATLPTHETDTSPTVAPSDQTRSSSLGGSSERKTNGGSRGGWSNQDAQQAGREAQEWLREQLKDLLSQMGWSISYGAERDEQGRETDILLRKGKEEIHIEVKHMKSDPRLYWSEREVSKAKDYRGKYFIALLSPNSEANGYKVRWLWDPINELQECWDKRTVSGVWVWNDKQQPVGFQELGGGPWCIPNPRPSQEAHNFSFEIKLNDLKCSADGLEAITTKLSVFDHEADPVQHATS